MVLGTVFLVVNCLLTRRLKLSVFPPPRPILIFVPVLQFLLQWTNEI